MTLHLVLDIIWLAIAWGVAWAVFRLATSPAKVAVKFRKMTVLVYPLLMVVAVAAAIFFKTFIFGIYEIPSSSMEKTLVPGDIVWVNNMAYGPRLPYSPYEIPWVNLLVWLCKESNTDIAHHWWGYKRLKGYGKPHRGDVVVFNHPVKGNIYIKRMVALPGDTLQIVDGSLLINGVLYPPPVQTVFYSKISFHTQQAARRIPDSLGLQIWPQNDSGIYNGFLTDKQMQTLNQHSGVLHAGIDPHRADTAWQVYPWAKKLDWSIDNYGPYVIPYKGMVLAKSSESLRRYGPILAQENPGKKIDGNNSEYCFEHDYFFMMGDNFHDSEDSRYYGPVKEELLIGKASFILFSKSDKYERMKRIFCNLN